MECYERGGAIAQCGNGVLWNWGKERRARSGTLSAPGHYTGPTKKDGSLWLMDASDFDVNLRRGPSKAVRFRRVELEKDVVGYMAGVAHAAAPGMHAPIGVALTREGEVWTWGLVLGDPRGLRGRLELNATKLANRFSIKASPPYAAPAVRQTPWQLPQVEPGPSP